MYGQGAVAGEVTDTQHAAKARTVRGARHEWDDVHCAVTGCRQGPTLEQANASVVDGQPGFS